VQQPQTRYVQRGEVSIAYQVVGDLGSDLIIVPGFISHLDLQWTDPGFSRFCERLASFTRLILYDKPGTGLSDPIPHVPTLEERIADIRAVLDAVDSHQAALFGFSEGGPVCALFAATWPERTSALVLYGTYPCGRPSVEQLREPGATLEEYERVVSGFAEVVAHWGEGRLGRLIAPSAQGELQRRFWGIFERAGASPAMARALIEASMRADVTAILPTIQAPTLVLHRTGEVFPIAGGCQLARAIPGARLVELVGEDHAFWAGDIEPVIAEIEEFLTGMRTSAAPDRLLATILFTDIVGSTERASELGDRVWHELLDEHNTRVRELLEQFGGRELDTAGDGFFASFEGPGTAVRCACAIGRSLHELGLEIRAGVHTGECERIGDKLGGLAVHIGARIAAIARGGEVLASRTVRDLVAGSGLKFTDRGTHRLRGIDEPWQLFAVEDAVSSDMQLTGPREHMGAADRALVQIARRAPAVLRLGARLAVARRPNLRRVHQLWVR
jgi:class 3 adenylate cyclase